jgi:hypothetical protein
LSQALRIATGALITGSSNYLQQLCTNPTFQDISQNILARRDVYFGSNLPSALLKCRGKLSLPIVWGILALSTAPIHLALPAVTGVSCLQTSPNYVGIRASDDLPNATFQIPFETRYAGHGYTIVSLANIKSRWTEVPPEKCQAFRMWEPMDGLVLQNIIVTISDTSFKTIHDNWRHMYEDAKFVSLLPSEAEFSRCFVEYLPSVCHYTVRWLPLLVVGVAVLVKAIVCELTLHFHPHFRQRIFNCLGDVLWLSARHPELCSRLPSLPEMEIKNRRRIPWIKSLSPLDYSVLILWWACSFRLIWLGWEGLQLHTTRLDFSATMDMFSPLPFNSTLFVANIPHVWVAVAYYVWNNQVSRYYMEREWRSYYQHRRLLRVSYDTNDPGVRSTSLLQLPPLYSALVKLITVVLHWILSHAVVVEEQVSSSQHILKLSAGTILIAGIISGVAMLGVTTLYFLPVITWMPLMGGSLRTVLYFACHLSYPLPANGISWGEISDESVLQAGFSAHMEPMRSDLLYPSAVGLQNDRYESNDVMRLQLQRENIVNTLQAVGLMLATSSHE